MGSKESDLKQTAFLLWCKN